MNNLSDKSMSSSSSTSNKLPSILKGVDENFQNLKKPHFMSPTISASSKANPPRKKVLSERNEALDTQNNSILDSKSTHKISTTSSSSNFGDNQENSLIDDLSSRPYDPLTNYLSPRPKFLRYNPSRRRRTFLGIENENKKSTDLGQETDEKKEEEEEVIDDSDDEEFEEADVDDGSWGFKGVLKFLIFMGVLVLSTMYISDMNSPTPSPLVDVVGSVKDGYFMVQDHVYGFVKNRDTGNLFFVETEGSELRFSGVEGFFEEEKFDRFKIEEEEIDDEKAVDIVDGMGDVFSEEVSSSRDFVMPKPEGFFSLYQVAADSDLQRRAILLESEAGAVGKDNEVVQEPIREEISDKGIGGIQNVGDFISDETEIVSNAADDKVVDEPIQEGNSVSGGIQEAEISTEETVLRHKEVEPISKWVIGFSAIIAIIAYVVLQIHFRKKRNAREQPDTIPEPCFASAVPNQSNLEGSLPSNREEAVHIEEPVSFANSRPLRSLDSEPTLRSHAPTVALLGELDVGEMGSQSLRRCGVRSRAIESEVSSHSISVGKGISNKADSAPPIQFKSDYSEVSSAKNDASKIEDQRVVKELDAAGDEEVKKKKKKKEEISTPLRRSSRLQNRGT